MSRHDSYEINPAKPHWKLGKLGIFSACKVSSKSSIISKKELFEVLLSIKILLFFLCIFNTGRAAI